MSVDWGQALAAGVASGAEAYGGQLQKQQDDARWLEREKTLDDLHRDAQKDNERFLMGLKPPETRKLNVSGKSGPAIQQQEWVPPADGEAAGHFQNVGDETPDINFERLDETSKHNRETESLTADRNAATAAASEARLDLARTRLEAAASKKTGTESQPKTYTFEGPGGRPVARVGHFSDGVFVPAVDEKGNPVQAEKYKPTSLEQKDENARKGTRDAVGPSYPKDPYNDATRKPVDERGGMFSKDAPVAPVFVDPSKDPETGQDIPIRGTLSQLRPQKAPTSTPASARGVAPAANHGKVVRTGTDAQGRRVAKYEDGFVGPAP